MYDLHDFLTAIPVHELNDDKGYTDGQFAKHIAIYENELPDITGADIVFVFCCRCCCNGKRFTNQPDTGRNIVMPPLKRL